MSLLCRRLIHEIGSLPAGVTGGLLAGYPEKILQFGEGRFLRGFADWMVDILNERGLFGGRVVVVQPLHEDKVRDINAQDGFYTVLLVVEMYLMLKYIRLGPSSLGTGRYHDERAAAAVAARGVAS